MTAADVSVPLSTARKAVTTVFGSVSLSIAGVGACLFVAAALIRYGVWPAIMAIWGAFLLVFGLCWYLLVWWTRR
jgi:hypothetical protein